MLFLQNQSVLVPDEVRRLNVEAIALHAALEQTQDVAVVWISSECQLTAIVHELTEFGWLVCAKLLNGDFLLLALDVIIFFRLGATGEALPRQRATEEVKQYVADGFEVIAS